MKNFFTYKNAKHIDINILIIISLYFVRKIKQESK